MGSRKSVNRFISGQIMVLMKSFLLPTEKPGIHPTSFTAPGAAVVGAVGKNVSVWYPCAVRDGINRTYIGPRSNIQGGTVIHVSDDLCRDGAPPAGSGHVTRGVSCTGDVRRVKLAP